MTDVERERLFWSGLARELAHRMGTPLSALFGWLELLPDSKDPAKVIEEMRGNLIQLTSISERLGQIGLPTKFEIVPLEETFDTVIAYVKPRLPSGEPGIQFNKCISDNPKVRANRALLEWTIEHLIRNSIDAVDRNSGQIDLRSYIKDKDIVLEVTDNGSGIDENAKATIFESGFSTRRGGRGVGLTLAKYIVEEVHRGEFALLESTPQKGTTFRIVLSASEAP